MNKQLVILYLSILGCVAPVIGQVKIIKDPHVAAQADRMVATSWGNWLPKAKYFLGLQTNIHYTMTWGWLAGSSKYDHYKNGPDIRPLGPAGEQTQRNALSMAMDNYDNLYKQYSDSVGATAVEEIANYAGVTAAADPLWLLYYSKVLKPVKNYDLSLDTASLSQDQKNYLRQSGYLSVYDEAMNQLHSRLDACFSTDMDRGQRMVGYQRILLEYRKIKRDWDAQLMSSGTILTTGKLIKQLRPQTGSIHFDEDFNATDREIMQRIMRNAIIF